MRKVLPFVLPCLLLLGLLVKRHKPEHFEAAQNEAVVFETSMRDTLPEKVLHRLGLGDQTGIKIQYRNGHYASYFDYQANSKDLLQAISCLPFSKYATRADATYHSFSVTELETLKHLISATELEGASFFWSADLSEYEMYEALKPPFRHTLLINKNSDRVLHRIELIAG